MRVRAVLLMAFAWAALAVPARGAGPPEGTLVLAEGPPRAAQLVNFDGAGRFQFRVGGQEETLAAANLLTWGTQAEAEVGPVVALVDGSLLVGDLVSLTPQEVVVDHSLFGEVKLPLERVRGLVLRVPLAARPRDALWERVLAGQGTSDQVLLENGDRVAGSLEGIAPLETELRVATKSGKISLGLAQVLALGVNPALAAAPPVGAAGPTLGLRDGSLLRTRTLTRSENRVEIELRSGVKLATDDAERLLSRIAFVRGTSDRVQYVSDLAPLGYKQVPFLDLEWPYRLDRNVLGGRLRAGGRVYEKGVGMHSSSRLAWRLPAAAKRFEAEVALDDAAGRGGSVVFRVYVGASDGKFRLAYESPVVRGGEAPRPVRVDVAGGAQLALIVDFADRGDVLDHANWLEARLVK